MMLKFITTLTVFFVLMAVIPGCKTLNNDFKKERIVVNNKNREYFIHFPNKAKDAKPAKVLFFLHGLLNPKEVFSQFSQIIQAVEHLDSVMVVFPIGLKQAFALHPDMLGWTPGHFKDNVLFLESIIAQLKKDYKTNEIVVIGGGFSNGAYFLSQILQSEYSRLFFGFWLQGGGNPQPLPPHFIKKKVFLEVGSLDSGNIRSVRELKSHLLQHGWQEGHNFFYMEFDEGHRLYLKNIERILNDLAL